jgi:hypothetical protein
VFIKKGVIGHLLDGTLVGLDALFMKLPTEAEASRFGFLKVWETLFDSQNTLRSRE